MIVDVDHQDLHHVANSTDVGNIGHVLIGQLADMAESVATGKDLDESAENP